MDCFACTTDVKADNAASKASSSVAPAPSAAEANADRVATSWTLTFSTANAVWALLLAANGSNDNGLTPEGSFKAMVSCDEDRPDSEMRVVRGDTTDAPDGALSVRPSRTVPELVSIVFSSVWTMIS